ncbi:hypothetical protein H5410_064298, partial [Solanum commersonii]
MTISNLCLSSSPTNLVQTRNSETVQQSSAKSGSPQNVTRVQQAMYAPRLLHNGPIPFKDLDEFF